MINEPSPPVGRPLARFRFYEELNDFLAPLLRKRDIDYRCARAASVKNAIEALGVPHTEVELILVNGESVDFSYQVREGDSVSVYPKFESFDIQPLPSISDVLSDVLRPRRVACELQHKRVGLAPAARATGRPHLDVAVIPMQRPRSRPAGTSLPAWRMQNERVRASAEGHHKDVRQHDDASRPPPQSLTKPHALSRYHKC